MAIEHALPQLYQLTNSTQDELIARQLALFALLQQREQEFGVNPEVIIHYPEADFRTAPIHYLEQRLSELQLQGNIINNIVILTTYQQLHSDLMQACYEYEPVHMPAGPDATAIFRQNLTSDPTGKTLYIEAVNEQDSKIQPTFVLMLHDDDGKLQGGMSGSIWTQAERRYAYISTVVVQPNQPKGIGTRLAQTVLDYLQQQEVDEANLGTQTAEPFYTKLGFRVIHHIVPGLRYRIDPNGAKLPHNLVIMSKLF